MVVAWTYLLHAYYAGCGVDCRYFQTKGKRKIYEKVDGHPKTWELARCVKDEECPLDNDTRNNLLFLIGLRNEVEHARASELDTFLSGRYQACALNYNFYLKELFDDSLALDTSLAYSIQFAEMTFHQVEAMTSGERIPKPIRSYIAKFDDALTDEEFNSERYSYRIVFTRKLAGKKGQADSVVEFISPESELAESVSKEFWVQKEVERPKFRATDIVKRVQEAGFASFNVPAHTRLWQEVDGKNPAKGLELPSLATGTGTNRGWITF